MITRFPVSRSLLGGNPTNQDDDEEKRRKRRERGRRQIGERMRELSASARADNGRLVDATLKFSSPRDLPDLLALTVADHGEDSVKDLGEIFTELSKRDRGMARKLLDGVAPKIRSGSEFLAPSKFIRPANAPKLAAVRRRDFLDGLESIVDGDAPVVAARSNTPDRNEKPAARDERETNVQLAQGTAQGGSPPPPDVPNRTTNPPTSTTPIISLPAYKKDFFKKQPKSWPTWTRLIGSLPNLHSSEKRAYMEIFAAEGGDRLDPDSGAMSGITGTTIDRAVDKQHVSGIKRGTKPDNLSLEQRSRLYRAYFDHAFDRIGGAAAFGQFDDPEAASAVADTLFRHGRSGGGALIRKAINAITPGTLAVRDTKKVGLPFNETALPEFQKVISDRITRRKFLDALADERIKLAPGEAARFNHFRFQKSR